MLTRVTLMGNMRVVFLEVDTESDWAMASLGPAFLAAFLRGNGHESVMVRGGDRDGGRGCGEDGAGGGA